MKVTHCSIEKFYDIIFWYFLIRQIPSEEKLLEQKLRTCLEEFSDGIGFCYLILKQMS